MNDLAQHILDISQNSISAKASLITISIKEDLAQDIFEIVIEDNGAGMEKEFLERVEDPFVTTRTTRKVGLGIPLYKASALSCQGSFEIDSMPGEGTIIKAIFRHSHIDRPPLGKIEDTMLVLVTECESYDIIYSHSVDGSSFHFDTREIKKMLAEVPITENSVLLWIRDYIKEQLLNLYGGAY
jgi:hypothetical protein